MRKSIVLLVFLYFICAVGTAQVVTVNHNVNLRSNASTDNDPLATLTPGTHLQLIGPTPKNKYLHVRTDDGTQGWVWSRNVHIEEGETTSTATASSTSGHVGPN